MAYTSGFGAYRVHSKLEQAREPQVLGVFWEAWNRVEKHFYGDLPSPRERTYGAIRSVLALLEDPYTIFAEPQSSNLTRDRMRGAYGGVGVELGYNARGQIALSPYADSPAEKAGIRDGDVLVAIDDRLITEGDSIEDVKALLRGETGTSVTLTLSRPSDPSASPFDLTVARDEIQIPSITWRVIEDDLGYLRFTGFTERTPQETSEALQALQQMGVSGLILDLRDNAGGLLDPAVAVADEFLETGVALYQISRSEERAFELQGGGAATDIPLVVLVNGGTASAAEIVAGALQDHGRAPLIGERTFGKGSVQMVYSLSDGSSLHVTSAIWLTPDRHQIQGEGLSPDIPVTQTADAKDELLERAVEYLP